MKNIQPPDDVLTLCHYKEPLREVIDGFGYYGALSVSLTTGKLQCHICGVTRDNIGIHIRNAHNKMSVKEYRAKFMLSAKSALVSEDYRCRSKERMMRWLAKLTPEQRSELRMHGVRGGGRPPKNNQTKGESLEEKNKKGTCPDQLLEKITQVKEQLGHVPSKKEFIAITGGERYTHLIQRTFGSWGKALSMLNLTPQPASIRKGPVTHKSDEELLEYLVIYAQENGKAPSATDAKRGLIPDEELYRRRFGGIPAARELAGVYNFVERI